MSTILQSRPRMRPGNLTLSHQSLHQETKTDALLPYGRDAFLPCPTATAESFFNGLTFISPPLSDQSDSSNSDSSDDEDRRNTNDLLTGAFYDAHLDVVAIHSDSFDQHSWSINHDSSISESGPLFSGAEDAQSVVELPDPKHAKLIVNALHQFSVLHGKYPKLGLFADGYQPEGPEIKGDVVVFEIDSDDTESEKDDIETIDASIFLSQDDIVFAREEPAPAISRVEEPPTAFWPSYIDEVMSESSAKDDDDSDDDFVDFSYRDQQRRALAQYEKPIIASNHFVHPPVSRKTIILPSPSSSPSTPSRKRKTRSEEQEEYSDDSSESYSGASDNRKYTVIRERSGKVSYQCNMCPEVRTKAFGDMKRHLESLKHKAPSHRCDPDIYDFGCGRTFTRKDALKRHILSQHPIHWAIHESENSGPSPKRARK